MGTPVPAGLSRRGTLKLAAAVAGGLAVGAPLSGQQTMAQEEKLTASGGGVNLKLMPDVEGAPTVPLRESFMFDARYAQCIIEDNPEPFSMETYSMGKVVIDTHSFFMGMYANEIKLVSIRDLGDGRRVAKLTGALGCATEAGTASGRVGSREAQEPAFFEIEATDGGHGGGAARDSFVLAHRILGNLIGETLGYLFTAAWTLLVLVALGRSFAGLWFIALGAVSAVLILAGVLSPLDLPVIDLANFIGYVLWSIWLVVFGLLLLRRPRTGTAAPARARSNAKG